MKDTEPTIRDEQVFHAIVNDFLKSLSAPKPVAATCDCGYLEGYLAGIHSLSGHLLDELTA